ncbi:Diacylglycerol Kinase Iota [Manis pentadactyla]|nr:Diacylglycerol Kinase Iota [Manis pentadactyla]
MLLLLQCLKAKAKTGRERQDEKVQIKEKISDVTFAASLSLKLSRVGLQIFLPPVFFCSGSRIQIYFI